VEELSDYLAATHVVLQQLATLQAGLGVHETMVSRLAQALEHQRQHRQEHVRDHQLKEEEALALREQLLHQHQHQLQLQQQQHDAAMAHALRQQQQQLAEAAAAAEVSVQLRVATALRAEWEAESEQQAKLQAEQQAAAQAVAVHAAVVAATAAAREAAAEDMAAVRLECQIAGEKVVRQLRLEREECQSLRDRLLAAVDEAVRLRCFGAA
jgi:glucose repression mediator protein